MTEINCVFGKSFTKCILQADFKFNFISRGYVQVDLNS